MYHDMVSMAIILYFIQGLSRVQPPLLQWKLYEDTPTGMKNAKGVFFEGQLYIGGGFTGSPRGDTVVYVFNPVLSMWKILPHCPLKWFSMVVFMNQLVIVGGKETDVSVSTYTNKVATWNKESMLWTFTLPPMLARRCSPLIITHEHCLAAAGGNKGLLDYNIEILDSESLKWKQTSHLPVKCFTSLCTVMGNVWYSYREDDASLLKCDIHLLFKSLLKLEEKSSSRGDGVHKQGILELVDACGESLEANNHLSESETGKLLSLLFTIHCKMPFVPVQMTTIQGHLVALTQEKQLSKQLEVLAYFPDANVWTHIGNLPAVCGSATSIVSASGDLLLVGGDSTCSGSLYSRKVFHATVYKN